MAARVLGHHKQNPYRNFYENQNMVVFSPNDYSLSVLIGLSPAAMRVLFVLLSRLQPDGSAKVSFVELRKWICSPAPTLSQGLVQLAKHGLITKRGNGDYWVNPSLARTLSITG